MKWHRSVVAFLCLALSIVCRTTAAEDLGHLRPDAPDLVAPQALEQSFQRGVRYLVDSQRKSGAWGGPQWTGGVDSDPVPGAFRSFDVAVTAMCLEALLAAESTSAVVSARDRAFHFLLERTDQIKRAGPYDLPNVWAHCYSIQAFTRLWHVVEDGRKQEIESAIRSHMKGLKRWQSIHGGWFYYGSGMRQPINPSCSFVNAAVLVALSRAREIGLHADQHMVERAIEATKRMRKPDSSFLYSMRISADKIGAMQPINRPAGSLGRSQAGNLSLRLWGDERITDAVISVWLDRLVTRHGWLDMGRKRPIPHESHAAVAGYFYYFGVYYGGLCIGELPQDQQAFFQHHVAGMIMARQEKDGSWFDYPLYSYHKPYGTAFALLTLEQCRIGKHGPKPFTEVSAE
ncbi:MAG: hypothetical protein ACR2NZ_00755 [Rubripirellula sp.]